jgi:hypothetical protein
VVRHKQGFGIQAEVGGAILASRLSLRPSVLRRLRSKWVTQELVRSTGLALQRPCPRLMGQVSGLRVRQATASGGPTWPKASARGAHAEAQSGLALVSVPYTPRDVRAYQHP